MYHQKLEIACLIQHLQTQANQDYPLGLSSKKGKSNSTSTFGCKVILAKRNGKSFTELNQTYISVNEDSANVVFITAKVQEKWGRVVLVARNGLPIQDEEGTRG